MKMTFSPVRGLIVFLLFNTADAGKLLNLFYSVFFFFAFAARVKFEFEDKQEADSPVRTALSVFVSHCGADAPR